MDSGLKPWAVPQKVAVGVPQKRKPLLIGLITVSILIIITLVAIAKPVTVLVDGRKIQYITIRNNVGELLGHTNLNVFPEDSVLPGRTAQIRRGMTISIKRSVPVSINLDGKQMSFRTLDTTVGQALNAAGEKFGFNLKDSDEVEPARDSSIRSELKITVRTAVPITITADGVTKNFEIAPRTVKDVLAKEQISVGAKDLVTPSPDQLITANTVIKVVRIKEKMVTVQTKLPYQVVAKPGDFPLGLPDRVLSRGSLGLAQQVVKVTYEDGVESDRETLSQSIVRNPVNEVVARGAQTSVSRGGNTIRFKRAMLVRATGYCIPGGSTSVGVRVHRGVIAVDPGVIPYYSDLWVEGYGPGEALDTGGAINGKAIDLYFETEQEALNWGVRYVLVYIR